MKNNYNQRYWKKQYGNINTIQQWFKDYLTYYPISSKFNIEQIKKDFLQGEKNEILEIIENKEEQERIYKFVEKVINEMEV